MEELSDRALLVLCTIAYVLESLVMRLNIQFLSRKQDYLQYVHEELVDGVCLLDCEECEEEGVFFFMHHLQLVREFVLFDMKSHDAKHRKYD